MYTHRTEKEKGLIYVQWEQDILVSAWGIDAVGEH